MTSVEVPVLDRRGPPVAVGDGHHERRLARGRRSARSARASPTSTPRARSRSSACRSARPASSRISSRCSSASCREACARASVCSRSCSARARSRCRSPTARSASGSGSGSSSSRSTRSTVRTGRSRSARVGVPSGRTMLVLSRSDVEELLDLDALLDALAAAHAELSGGHGVARASRRRVRRRHGVLGAMAGYAPSAGLGCKLVTLFPGNRDRPTHQAIIALFEPDAPARRRRSWTGRTSRRCAPPRRRRSRRGFSRGRTRACSRSSAPGVQSRSAQEMFPRARDFAEVRVAGRGEFEDAVRGADVVHATTASAEPVVRFDWLEPGHARQLGRLRRRRLRARPCDRRARRRRRRRAARLGVRAASRRRAGARAARPRRSRRARRDHRRDRGRAQLGRADHAVQVGRRRRPGPRRCGARARGGAGTRRRPGDRAGGDSRMNSNEFSPGLAGVVAFETEIAEPDKDGGELRYRGVDIEDLVGKVPFEQVWGLLVDESLEPGLPYEHVDLERPHRRLHVRPAVEPRRAERRVEARPVHRHRRRAGEGGSPPALGGRALDRRPVGARRRPAAGASGDGRGGPDGRRAVRPRVARRAEREVGEGDRHVLDLHGRARSQRVDLHGADRRLDRAPTPAPLSPSAVGALSGPLHGGAPARVLPMLDAVAESGDAEKWVAEALGRGERIMGFGHRVYRAEDPRSRVLKRVAKELGSPRVAVAEELEQVAHEAIAKKQREPLVDERRVLVGRRPRRRRGAAAARAGDVRVLADGRLVGAHPRAEAARRPRPPVGALRRAGRALAAGGLEP